MNFRTHYKLKPAKHKIKYTDKLFFIGSCFAEHISKFFTKYRFQCVTNPYGILFHPKAIENLVQIALDNNCLSEENIFTYNDIWSSYDAHSSLSASDKSSLLTRLKTEKLNANKALVEAQFIFISLGTAWVYKNINTQNIVANCHKLPKYHFEKKLLDIEEIEVSLTNIVGSVQKVNPNVQIIFTLSPVRHLKDGFVENQLSKSSILVAIHKVISKNTNLSYFPSYELLLDDLRDYRFYGKDMVHPNEMALDYIWETLKTTMLDGDTQKVLKEVEAIYNRLQHKVVNPNSKTTKDFIKKTKDLKNKLYSKYPYLKPNNT